MDFNITEDQKLTFSMHLAFCQFLTNVAKEELEFMIQG